MDAVGAICFLLIATAALAALGGYIAGAVRQRNKKRDGRYFALGVVTGFVGASVMRRRFGRSAVRRFVLPHSVFVAALQLRRGLSRTGISR